MLEALTLATGVVILVIASIGFRRTRDPLSPVVVFTPMLLYVYVYSPLSILIRPEFAEVFPEPDDLVIVHVLNLLCVIGLLVGSSWDRRAARLEDRRFKILDRELRGHTRNRLLSFGVFCGAFANAAFWFMVYYSGGFLRVFSQDKPVLYNPFDSGYFGELPMMCYPALLMLALAWQGKKLHVHRVAMFALVGLPQLIMATAGGRRGPAFLIACTLFGCWCIVRQRRPKLSYVMLGVCALGLFVVLLGEHRSRLFQPWRIGEDWVTERQITPASDLSVGEEYIFGSGLVLTANQYTRHFWGVRYFATFFVRPIPKQIWPGKYEDLGLGWMESRFAYAGFSLSEWIDAVGFVPAVGSAGGMAADLFLEFSWGAVLACFLIGRMYSWSWKRWTTHGGLWTLLYVEMLILSIYLPAQSLGAWGYRAILLGLPTLGIWKFVIARDQRSRSIRAPLATRRAVPRGT
jgi:oligosaccharide repeat unit polymerase